MAYTDVISLTEAKAHLGVDDTSRDTEITRMIETCLSIVEEETNRLVQRVDKEYLYDEKGCVRVYDFPINTTTFADTVTRTRKTLYSIFNDTSSKGILNALTPKPITSMFQFTFFLLFPSACPQQEHNSVMFLQTRTKPSEHLCYGTFLQVHPANPLRHQW